MTYEIISYCLGRSVAQMFFLRMCTHLYRLGLRLSGLKLGLSLGARGIPLLSSFVPENFKSSQLRLPKRTCPCTVPTFQAIVTTVPFSGFLQWISVFNWYLCKRKSFTPLNDADGWTWSFLMMDSLVVYDSQTASTMLKWTVIQTPA